MVNPGEEATFIATVIGRFAQSHAERELRSEAKDLTGVEDRDENHRRRATTEKRSGGREEREMKVQGKERYHGLWQVSVVYLR